MNTKKTSLENENQPSCLGAVMLRCCTCKHWKQNTFYDYEGAVNDGFCSEIGSELIIELKTGWDGGYVDSIETKSTFGCVLHNEA
jgi:hypothetical protein